MTIHVLPSGSLLINGYPDRAVLFYCYLSLGYFYFFNQISGTTECCVYKF